MKDKAIELGYAAGWRLVRTLPRGVALALFTAAADRAYKANGPGTQRLRRNLRQVAGPGMDDALVRDGLRSYARYWLEAFRLTSLSKQQHLDGFRLKQSDEFHKVLAEGNGIILALPHSGNWDAAAAWVAASGHRLVTVMERLKPEKVYEQFIAYREKLGMEVMPLTGATRPPIDVLAERAQQGHAVALLSDRDLSARGVEVEFFGGRTRMPAGPALLALRTRAPLYAVDIWFEPDHVAAEIRRIELPDPADGPLSERVKLVTQRLADAYEIGIAAHPQDWHMLQKLWL